MLDLARDHVMKPAFGSRDKSLLDPSGSESLGRAPQREQTVASDWSVGVTRRRIVSSSHTICHHPPYNAKREVERSGRRRPRSLIRAKPVEAVWIPPTRFTDTPVQQRLPRRLHLRQIGCSCLVGK